MQSTRLIDRVKQHAEEFTQAERTVADYLLRFGLKVAFSKVANLSREIGVSEATLVRFARTLGYDSYSELQKDVQLEMQERLSRRPSQRLAGTALTSAGDALARVAEFSQENIAQTLGFCSKDDFTQAVDGLLAASRVYVFGLRAAGHIAAFTGYTLNLLLPDVRTVGPGVDDCFDAFLSASPSDVVLAIGISRQTKTAVRALDFARNRGARIIAITDSPASAYARLSDVVLLVACESPSVLVSFAGALMVVEAIVTAVGAKLGEQAGRRIQIMERVFDDFLMDPES